MSEENGYTELFNQYAVEVGRYLPRRKRKDIQLEILSLLEDSLEDQSEEAGQRPDEAMAIEVLKKFGPPIIFAANYRKDNHLIGGKIFQLFLPTLQIVLALFALQYLIGLGLAIVNRQIDILAQLDNLFDGGLQVFGLVVLTFALLERTVPESWLRWPFKEMEKTWHPEKLRSNSNLVKVKPGEVVFEAITLVGFVILFGAFPHWVGFGSNLNGEWNFVPVLSENFSVYLPWIISYFLAKLILDIYLVGQTYWDNRTYWAAIGIKVYGILILFGLKYGPAIFGVNQAYLAKHSPAPKMLEWFTNSLNAWNTAFQIIITINIIIHLILLVRMVLKATIGREEITITLK